MAAISAHKAIGLAGLILMFLSWILATGFLWTSLYPILPIYGEFEFALTDLGWEIVLITFGFGLVLAVSALLSVTNERIVAEAIPRNQVPLHAGAPLEMDPEIGAKV